MNASAHPFALPDVEWRSVSPKLIVAQQLAGLFFYIPVILISVTLIAVGLLTPAWWVSLLSVPLLALAGWVCWLIPRQVRAISFAEREDDLLIRKGILFRKLVVVPYGRMQFVDVEAGPLDRKFGIAKVQLHTASGASDAVIPGLPTAEAAHLRELLSARGEARLAGL